MGIQAEGALTGCLQGCSGLRITAGKQRDMVSLPNQLVSQVRDYPLCSSIELGRTALEKRRNLCDSHFLLVPRLVNLTKTIRGDQRLFWAAGSARPPELIPSKLSGGQSLNGAAVVTRSTVVPDAAYRVSAGNMVGPWAGPPRSYRFVARM